MTLEKNKPKFNNFALRFISAVVALAVLLASLFFFKTTGAFYLIIFINAIICFELANLFFEQDRLFKILAPAVATLSLILVIEFPENQINLLPIFLGLVALPWLYRNTNTSDTYDRLSVFLLIIFYGLYLPLQIHTIFNLDPNFIYFGFFALLVFGTDTFAYFFGKAFGRRFFKSNFQAQISPSKTIEGFLGSLLWPLVLILSFQYFSIFSFSTLSLILIYLTALAAISGDLIASLIKRKSKKKDSGQFFIGHGGFFDRLDSLLLSAPLFLISVPYIQLL